MENIAAEIPNGERGVNLEPPLLLSKARREHSSQLQAGGCLLLALSLLCSRDPALRANLAVRTGTSSCLTPSFSTWESTYANQSVWEVENRMLPHLVPIRAAGGVTGSVPFQASVSRAEL